MYLIKPIVLVVVKMHSFIHSFFHSFIQIKETNTKKRITFKKKEINVMDRKRHNLL